MQLVTLLSVMTWMTPIFGENQKTYEISKIDASPGLYFEKLHTMRLMTADWRVTIFLETQKLENQFPMGYERLNETYEGRSESKFNNASAALGEKVELRNFRDVFSHLF